MQTCEIARSRCLKLTSERIVETQLALDVEFAPYQKIPREKARKDSKMNTIDRDPEFVAFLEELAKPKEVFSYDETAVRQFSWDGLGCRNSQALNLWPTRLIRSL